MKVCLQHKMQNSMSFVDKTRFSIFESLNFSKVLISSVVFRTSCRYIQFECGFHFYIVSVVPTQQFFEKSPCKYVIQNFFTPLQAEEVQNISSFKILIWKNSYVILQWQLIFFGFKTLSNSKIQNRVLSSKNHLENGNFWKS